MRDKPAINTNVRLFDLVRHMRAELHIQDLITDEEYYWLCSEASMANSPDGGSPSPRRLEDYDKLREENAMLREQLKLETEKANARFDYAYELQTENAKLQKYVDYIERYADELTVNAAREEAQS